ncbi:MAG: 30S ribosomal protein S13 [Sphingobacteriaceae bacterium]|nr:MAG: 30S ribosomal protein S13 [Sphingobacteriaceae bacterium]
MHRLYSLWLLPKRYNIRLIRNQLVFFTFVMKFLISATFPSHTRLVHALANIRGLGRSSSLQICEQLGISPWLPLRCCTSRHLDNVTAFVLENFQINDLLREKVRQARARIRSISAYRSFRYAKGLPCRGQRTRSNSMTSRRLSVSERIPAHASLSRKNNTQKSR